MPCQFYYTRIRPDSGCFAGLSFFRSLVSIIGWSQWQVCIDHGPVTAEARYTVLKVKIAMTLVGSKAPTDKTANFPAEDSATGNNHRNCQWSKRNKAFDAHSPASAKLRLKNQSSTNQFTTSRYSRNWIQSWLASSSLWVLEVRTGGNPHIRCEEL